MINWNSVSPEFLLLCPQKPVPRAPWRPGRWPTTHVAPPWTQPPPGRRARPDHLGTSHPKGEKVPAWVLSYNMIISYVIIDYNSIYCTSVFGLQWGPIFHHAFRRCAWISSLQQTCCESNLILHPTSSNRPTIDWIWRTCAPNTGAWVRWVRELLEAATPSFHPFHPFPVLNHYLRHCSRAARIPIERNTQDGTTSRHWKVDWESIHSLWLLLFLERKRYVSGWFLKRNQKKKPSPE